MARSGGALRFRDVRQNGCGETRDGLPFPWRRRGRRERVLGEGPTWTNGDGWFAVRVRRDSDKDTRVAGLGRHSCRCPWPRARRSQHPRPCVSAPRRRRADRRVCNPHCSMARRHGAACARRGGRAEAVRSCGRCRRRRPPRDWAGDDYSYYPRGLAATPAVQQPKGQGCPLLGFLVGQPHGPQSSLEG